MTFAVAAAYGIAICVATVALMQLFSATRPPAVARSSVRHTPAEPPRPSWTFGRKDIR
jgi:hypothetical protein